MKNILFLLFCFATTSAFAQTNLCAPGILSTKVTSPETVKVMYYEHGSVVRQTRTASGIDTVKEPLGHIALVVTVDGISKEIDFGFGGEWNKEWGNYSVLQNVKEKFRSLEECPPNAYKIILLDDEIVKITLHDAHKDVLWCKVL